MDGISLSYKQEGTAKDTQLFIVKHYDNPIGWIQFREVKTDFPIGNLLRFLNSPKISDMCKGVHSTFPVNYYWLEMLYLEPLYRGNNWGVEALNILLSRLPAYSVMAAYPHKTADMEVDDLISYYKKHNFHVLDSTTGNLDDRILFTFVQNR